MQIEIGQRGVKTVEGLGLAPEKWKAEMLQKIKAKIADLRQTKKPIVESSPFFFHGDMKFFKPPDGPLAPGTLYYNPKPR